MNPYEKHFEELSESITKLKGTLYHVSTALKNYSKDFMGRHAKFDNLPDFALGSFVVASDLTHFGQKGIPRVYPCPGRHVVKLSEYETETNALINRERAFSAAHCYERLESFMKDILLQYYLDSTLSAANLKLYSKLSSTDPVEIRREISRRTGKNNVDLLRTFRKIAPSFEKFEKRNIREVDFTLWYKVFAVFRHSVTHRSGKLSIDSEDYKSLDSKSREILKEYFPNINVENELIFELAQSDGERIFRMTCEYGFQIFKAVSLQNGYEWRVLTNMENVY